MYMYIVTLRTFRSKHNNVANATFETSKMWRQSPANVFDLKTPTKLKIHINPTKLRGFHDTFLTQKDIPKAFPAKHRFLSANFLP